MYCVVMMQAMESGKESILRRLRRSQSDLEEKDGKIQVSLVGSCLTQWDCRLVVYQPQVIRIEVLPDAVVMAPVQAVLPVL